MKGVPRVESSSVARIGFCRGLKEAENLKHPESSGAGWMGSKELSEAFS